MNQIYNLSSGNKIIIKNLIELMLKISGRSQHYKIKEASGTQGDSFGQSASIEKLKYDFNWKPDYTLEQGLKIYFNWINKLPKVDDLNGFHPLEMANNEK